MIHNVYVMLIFMSYNACVSIDNILTIKYDPLQWLLKMSTLSTLVNPIVLE